MTDYQNIEIQYVNPRRDRVPPSIKDTYGTKYTVSDAALSWFQVGQQGEIGYYQNDRGYNVATEWDRQPLPRDQGARSGGMQQAGRAAPPPRRPAGPPQQRPQGQRPGPTQPDTKSEDMFVMGVVGRAMGSGKFGIEDIQNLAREAAHAWKSRNAPPPPPSDYGDGPGEPQDDRDLDDEIPY